MRGSRSVKPRRPKLFTLLFGRPRFSITALWWEKFVPFCGGALFEPLHKVFKLKLKLAPRLLVGHIGLPDDSIFTITFLIHGGDPIWCDNADVGYPQKILRRHWPRTTLREGGHPIKFRFGNMMMKARHAAAPSFSRMVMLERSTYRAWPASFR